MLKLITKCVKIDLILKNIYTEKRTIVAGALKSLGFSALKRE